MRPENFYKNPEIQKKLLEAIGNSSTMLVQTHNGKQIIRRYDEHKEPIKLTQENFGEWARKHLAEIHPVYGVKTDQLTVDIDPGKDVNWNDVRRMTIELTRRMQNQPQIKDVAVQFSGGRGFYVKGKLDHQIATDKARELTNNMLREFIEANKKAPEERQVTNPVMKKPEADQIRLDISTLHDKGSLRAPFSLNVDTGLVSAPVSLEDLPNVKRQDFTPQKILKNASELSTLIQILDDVPMLIKTLRNRQQKEHGKALAQTSEPVPASYPEPVNEILKTSGKKEFAPGIPASREIKKIPEVKEPVSWDLAIQKHIADKAGKHFDVRLVDPAGHAHSFAVPKAKLPSIKDKMLLAIQQATHTKDYALNFEGSIPAGTYGAGTVTRPIKEKVEILNSNDNNIKFKRPDGSQFALFRTAGKNWGFRRIA